MPYPASPPVPPAITTSSAEDIQYSKPSYAAPEPNSVAKAETLDVPIRPASDTAVAPQPSTPQVTVADFAKQSGESRADLLGATATAGYLLKDNSPPRNASQAVIPLPSNALPANRQTADAPGVTTFRQHSQHPIAQEPDYSAVSLSSETARHISSNRSSPLTVPHQRETGASAPFSVYSFSGLRGDLSRTREADLISGLNQAIGTNGHRENTALFGSTNHSNTDLKIVAQTEDVPRTILSIPNNDIPLSAPSIPPQPAAPSPNQPTAPGSSQPGAPQQRQETPSTDLIPGTGGVVELNADRQEFDEQRQIFTAEGNVTMRFQGSLLDADRLQVNLVNRLAVAEGNVALTRGNQVLRGQRFEYNFVQGAGTIQQASGTVNLGNETGAPAGVRDESVIISRPVSDRVTANQPVSGVSSPGGFSTGIGAGRNVGRVPGALPTGGTVNRLRFEAEQIDFTPEGWTARNIQLTNDPFSPPELVLRADQATLTRVSPLRDEVRATRPRLVFDQRLSIPLLASRVVLDRSERPPALFQFGFDQEDRGGFFVERSFEILRSSTIRFSITPQIFLQRIVAGGGGPFDPSNYGGIARISANFGPRTSIQGRLSLTSLDRDEITDNLRASLRARQLVGTHTLGLEYSYRDRLFNGSLGFQTVQSSLGAILISPVIALGNTGINLTYQAGIQNINADTDRLNLLRPIRDDNRVNLSRYQASAAITRGFTLWRGTALPATPTEGLRYSPVPIVPYIGLNTRLEGVFSGYSNGDSQQNLIANVGLFAQFGRFSRPFFDYTAVNITYIQIVGRGQSPFLFDRTVDNRILSAGVIQQIYGPIRAGFQTVISLNTNERISTDYILEYSRRTYAITLRFNPVLEIGSLNFRISDFNWTGGSQPFSGVDVTPVEGGVRRGEENLTAP